MKLSLQLKLGQQLTMTPQLQQAIKLLQLSTIDLQQEIHQALESNPMLEMDEESEDAPESNSLNEPATSSNEAQTSLQTTLTQPETKRVNQTGLKPSQVISR